MKKTISVKKDILLLVEKYFNLEHLDFIAKQLKNNKKDCRYDAYVFCRKYFTNNYKNKTSNDVVEVMSLHLFSYLSSFGMVNYRTHLSKSNYKIMNGVVKILCNEKYSILEKYNLLNKKNNEDFIEKILKLKKRLSEYFRNELNKKSNFETLITKIILGTFGCVPAYDTKVIKRLRKCKIASTFDKKSLKTIIEILKVNEGIINKFYDTHKNVNKSVYTPMRLFDLCFWDD